MTHPWRGGSRGVLSAPRSGPAATGGPRGSAPHWARRRPGSMSPTTAEGTETRQTVPDRVGSPDPSPWPARARGRPAQPATGAVRPLSFTGRWLQTRWPSARARSKIVRHPRQRAQLASVFDRVPGRRSDDELSTGGPLSLWEQCLRRDGGLVVARSSDGGRPGTVTRCRSEESSAWTRSQVGSHGR